MRKIYVFLLILFTFFTNDKTFSQWENVVKTFKPGNVFMAIDSNKIVVGTRTNGHFYITYNDGISWDAATSLNKNLGSLIISNNKIFAGTESGVYVSTNNCQSWSLLGLENRQIISLSSDSGLIAAGTVVYGVYITDNNRQDWIQTALNNKSVNSISISGNKIFASARVSSGYYTVYLSTNNGISWQETALKNMYTYGENISLLTIGNNLYATHYYGVLKSVIGSNNYDLLLNRRIFALTFSNNTLLAGGDYGIYTTTNDGVSWHYFDWKLGTIISMAAFGNRVCASNQQVFFSTNSGTSFYSHPFEVNNLQKIENKIIITSTTGIFSSEDKCTTWKEENLNFRNVKSFAKSGNNFLAGVADSGVYSSTNNGANWERTSLNDKTVNTLIYKGGIAYAGTTGSGIITSTNNGVSWVQSSLADITVNTITAKDSTLFAGTIIGGVYKSTNSGLTWNQTSLNLKTVYVLENYGNNVYAGTQEYGVYFTSNDGQNWVQTTLNNKTIRGVKVYGNSIFAGTEYDGVYVSTNNGANWTQVNDGFGPGHQNITTLEIDNGYLFAGTNSYGIYRRYILEFAPIRGDANLDSAVNVLDVTSVVNYILGNIPSVFNFRAADVNNDNLINVLDVVGVINIIMNPGYDAFAVNRNNDNSGSGSLSLQNNSLMLSSTVPVSAMQFRISGTNASGVTFTSNSILNQFQVVGGNQGDTSRTYIIYSINNSLIPGGLHNLGTFSGLNAGMTMRDVIVVDSLCNNILTVIGNELPAELPIEYSLSHNYPNPFNPRTTISFQLPKSGMTKLSVYDVTGRLLKTLLNEHRNAGYYKEVFDAGMLSSGVYFYSLEAGDFKSTRKMIVIK